MQWTCDRVERARVDHSKGSFACTQHGQFREPHVVTYPHAELAVLRVNSGGLLPRAQGFTFMERYAVGNVHIEKVDFPMLANQLSIFVEDYRCIVDLVCLWIQFWNRASALK